ncbi:TPA: hypothetical protein ACWXCU_004646 [Klebsiella pneumoniae]
MKEKKKKKMKGSKNIYYHYIQEVINLSTQPICIRENSGEFLICNKSFSEFFLRELKLTEWLSSVDFEISHKLCELEIEAYSLDIGVVIEENIVVNGKMWDFIVTKLIIENNTITVWKFSRIYRKIGMANRFSSNILNAITSFKEIVAKLNESQRNTLALYYLGASHNFISKILNISVGTSKNRILHIQNNIPIDNKDEIFIIIHVSGMSLVFIKHVIRLLSTNVNRLLKK